MERRPLISIVMPVYNNETYLASAVNSVLMQGLAHTEDIELIIIDDGSVDHTPEIADDFARRDERVRVIHQENQWIYASFNNGISIATGIYIYIVNSDDNLVEGALSLLIHKIYEYDFPDVIWTKVLSCRVDEKQNILSVIDMSELIQEEKYIDNINKVHDIWPLLQKTDLILNQANLYKRDIMYRHPFRNDVYGSDTLFNISIANEIHNMLILPEPIYRYFSYNQSNRNLSENKYYAYEHDMFNEIMLNSLQLYEKWGIEEEEYLEFLVTRRLRQLTHEIEALGYTTCTLCFEEKIKKIYLHYADPLVRKFSCQVHREREYESRILNGTANLFQKCSGQIHGDMKFVLNLIANLPKKYYENIDRTKIDYTVVKAAIYNKLNPDHIGKIYYSQDWQNV